MLQNKILFNQSSVSLEIIGLPDYSNNETKDRISIISQWKLTIIDRPLIEGNLDQLKVMMDAFYSYTGFLLNDEIALYQSKLIDMKSDNFFTHNILLKSTKPDVKPLNLKIGNSIFADIINCFDQLRSSDKVSIIYSKEFRNVKNKKFLTLFDKHKITSFILPPLISLCSIFITSTAFIYFYNTEDNDNTSSYIYPKNELISITSSKTIL